MKRRLERCLIRVRRLSKDWGILERGELQGKVVRERSLSKEWRMLESRAY